MSYILEALRKLEKERKRGRIPGLSEQDSIVYHSQKRPIWPYLLTAASLLTSVLLIWWFLPRAGDKDAPAALSSPQEGITRMTPAVLSPPEESAKSVSPPALIVPHEVKRPDDAAPGKLSQQGASERSVVSPPAASSPFRAAASPDQKQPLSSVSPQEGVGRKSSLTKIEPKVADERQKSGISQSDKEAEDVAAPVPKKNLYKLSELPPSVRESLQKFFTITAYMYSSVPSERVVRINDQMMREGQEMEPGIRIEEIVSEGVILSYKKFRFLVNVK